MQVNVGKLTFGDLVRYHRRRNGLSLNNLVIKMGGDLCYGYISMIETQGVVPSPEIVIKLARLLSVEPLEMIEVAKETQLKGLKDKIERKYKDAFKNLESAERKASGKKSKK